MSLQTTKWDVIWPASKLICLDKHDEQNIQACKYFYLGLVYCFLEVKNAAADFISLVKGVWLHT